MNINIFVGLLVAMMAIYFGAPDVRQDVFVYLDANSFILVFFGTIGSSLISTSFSDFQGLSQLFKNLFFSSKKQLSLNEAIEIMVKVSQDAQSVSRQALPGSIKGKNDLFLIRSMDMVAAGLDKEFIIQTLETDIDEIRNRHAKKVNTVRTMGSFAPMFGMAGTVIGVIQVLKNVTDIDNIVSGMALALLTTLYGLFFSSIFFIPLSNKLKNLSEQELLTKQIIAQGVEMVLDKEIPLKVEKYLTAYVQSTQKEAASKK